MNPEWKADAEGALHWADNSGWELELEANSDRLNGWGPGDMHLNIRNGNVEVSHEVRQLGIKCMRLETATVPFHVMAVAIAAVQWAHARKVTKRALAPKPEPLIEEPYGDSAKYGYQLHELARAYDIGEFDPEDWNWCIHEDTTLIEDVENEGKSKYAKCLALYVMGQGGSQCHAHFHWHPDSAVTEAQIEAYVKARFGVERVLYGVG